jgi:CRP-like cAMP-binding protein
MPEHSDLAPYLARLNRRSILTDDEQALILALPTRVQQVRPNEDFVRLGERVDHACFVVEGLVARFDQNVQGGRQITALHIPGDMPDLLSVVQPAATSALQALSTSTILKIPHSAIRELASAHPAIAEAFWRDCMVDAMILAQWIVNVGRRDALARLAHLLCEMACRYHILSNDDELTYEMPMTQVQLADVTGLTPVHVNRSLKKLAETGTSIRFGHVVIASWDALTKVGDFDRGYLQEDIDQSDRIRICE